MNFGECTTFVGEGFDLWRCLSLPSIARALQRDV